MSDSLVTTDMDEKFAELLVTRRLDYDTDINRLMKYEELFTFLRVLAIEFSEDEYSQNEERWARVYLSDYCCDLSLGMGKHDNKRTLLDLLRTIWKSLGRDWNRSDNPRIEGGKLTYGFTNKTNSLIFDLEVHVSNAGKCEISQEETFKPTPVETRIVDGKSVTGVVGTKNVYNCGEFFLDPHELKEAIKNELSA